MSPDNKPKIIIHEDLRNELTPQVQQGRQNPRASARRSEYITRKALGNKKLQETQPASVLSPAAITRAETSAILDRIFTQEPAQQQVPAPASQADKTAQSLQSEMGDTAAIRRDEALSETARGMGSGQLWQFAYYYQTYPAHNPATPPQETLKSAENLMQYLQYGLDKLKIPMPKLIAENFERLKQVLAAYNGEYMRLLKTSPHSIETLNENYLRHPKTVTLCAQLVDDLKRFGQDVYGELAETREREEQLEVLESPVGRQIQLRYPMLGQTYEAAPDALEIAKKDYLERLRQSAEKDLSSFNAAHGEDPNLSSQFAPKKVADFIVYETFHRIASLVDGLNLSAEEKTEILGSLPTVILNQHGSADNGTVSVVFGTDKPLPPRMGGEFETSLTTALLKAKLLGMAAYEDEVQIRWILQNYSRAVKDGRIQCLENANSAITISYKRGETQLTAENFYNPVSKNDEDFFGQLLALIHKNGNAALLKKELQDGIQTQQSGSKTFVAYGNAIDFHSSFMKTLDHLSHPLKKEADRTQSDMPPARKWETVQDAVNSYTLLRAYSVSALKEKNDELNTTESTINDLRLEKLRGIQEAHEVARHAYKKAQETLDWAEQRLLMLRGATNIFSRGIREKIDAVLDELAGMNNNDDSGNR